MSDCFLHYNSQSILPVVSGTAPRQIVKESGNNWYMLIYGTGTITFNDIGSIADYGGNLSVFLVGGGGAGAIGGGCGGGGRWARFLESGVSSGSSFLVYVGSGGGSSGAGGGYTQAFGTRVEGGQGGSSSASYQECVVHSENGIGGNVYYYNSASSSGTSLGQGYHTVNLLYPTEWTTITPGSSTQYVVKGYPRGYYKCVIDSSIIKYEIVNGSGGDATYAYNSTGGVILSASGTIGNGSTANAVNVGQGGGGNGTSGFGTGMQGYVVIRPSWNA